MFLVQASFHDVKIYFIYRHQSNTRIFPVTKISYPVKIRFLSFTCEDITVVMANSVSAKEIYKSFIPHCYNIQDSYKRHLFPSFFDQNSNVSEF